MLDQVRTAIVRDMSGSSRQYGGSAEVKMTGTARLTYLDAARRAANQADWTLNTSAAEERRTREQTDELLGGQVKEDLTPTVRPMYPGCGRWNDNGHKRLSIYSNGQNVRRCAQRERQNTSRMVRLASRGWIHTNKNPGC